MDWLLGVELLTYALFLIVAWHAWKRGRIALVLSAALFGLMLEYIDIIAFEGAYYYAEFAVMIAHVPLWIAVAWSLLIYCAWTTSERLRLPDVVKPVYTTLLLLLFDIGIDPTASFHFNYWHWGPFEAEWYSVPAVNFFGWFIAVGAFTLFYWLYEKRFGTKVAVLATPPTAVIPLVTLSSFWLYVLPAWLHWPGLALILLGAWAFVFLNSKHVKTDNEVDWTLVLVPAAAYAYFNIAALFSGFAEILPYAIPLMVAFIAGFLWPSINRLRSRA